MVNSDKTNNNSQTSSETKYPENTTVLGPSVDIQAELKGDGPEHLGHALVLTTRRMRAASEYLGELGNTCGEEESGFRLVQPIHIDVQDIVA